MIKVDNILLTKVIFVQFPLMHKHAKETSDIGYFGMLIVTNFIELECGRFKADRTHCFAIGKDHLVRVTDQRTIEKGVAQKETESDLNLKESNMVKH